MPATTLPPASSAAPLRKKLVKKKLVKKRPPGSAAPGSGPKTSRTLGDGHHIPRKPKLGPRKPKPGGGAGAKAGTKAGTAGPKKESAFERNRARRAAERAAAEAEEAAQKAWEAELAALIARGDQASVGVSAADDAALARAIELGKAIDYHGRRGAAVQLLRKKVEARLIAWVTELELRRLKPGEQWELPKAKLRQLPQYLDRAFKLGRTPLVLESEQGEVGTFLTYSDDAIRIVGKSLVVRKYATKTATDAELHAELRKDAFHALVHGKNLWVDLVNSAPSFSSVFCDPGSFPAEIFQTRQFTPPPAGAVDADAAPPQPYGAGALMAEPEKLPELFGATEGERDALRGIVHPGVKLPTLRMIVTSQFGREDAAEFLEAQLPYFAEMQQIVIVD